MKKIFFVGGPGNISATTLQDLLERGKTLGLFTLPESARDADRRAKVYPGNRDDTPALEAALKDFRPDIVLDFVCFTPPQAEALLPLVTGKLAQFVFVSTVDVYGYPLSHLPMREADPWNPPNCDYAADKRLCEEIFHRPGPQQLPLTVVRPAYSFGPGFVLTPMSRGDGLSMITRLRNRMPLLIPGDGNTLIHVSAAPNTGRMIARVVGNPKSISSDYTVAHDSFMTHDDYVRLFAGVLGVEPSIVHIPTEIILSCNDPATRDSLLHVLTRFNVAFSVDKFKADFPDFEWKTSLVGWARHYIEENDRRGAFPPPTETIFDDRLIAVWQKMLEKLQL